MKKLLPLFIAFLVLAVLAVAQPDITSGAGSYTVQENNVLTVPFAITPAQGVVTMSKNVSFGTLTPTTGVGTSATFVWTPATGQAGVYNINFIVSNGSHSSSALIIVTVTPTTTTMSATQLTLGDSSQRRSNPQDDTKSNREVNVTGEITITNTGGRDLSGLTASVNIVGGFSTSDLKPNVTFSSTSIPIGGAVTAYVQMRVPEQLDGVDNSDAVNPLQVATITFSAADSSAGAAHASSEVDMQARNMISLKKGQYTVNSGDSSTLSKDTTIKNLKPDDQIDMSVDAKNLFTNSQNVEIQDITLRLEISDLDVDESTDIGSLSTTETGTGTISFTIDSSADDGSFDGILTLEGTDENGARHAVVWNPTFTIERKSHDITLISGIFSPDTVTCENTVSLSVKIKNQGRNDESHVSLHLESQDLNYGTVINNIDLNQDDSVTKTFTIPMPANLGNGVKRVIATTYYSTSTESNSDTYVFTKASCQPTTPVVQNQTTTQPPIIVITNPPTNESNVVAQPVQQAFTETSAFTALLILGYIVVIVAGIYLIGKALRK